MSELVGNKIGNYELTRHLGRGGMADVYEALHKDLDVHRAIKVIRPDFVSSEDFRQRFLREARAAAQLEHPNIVRVYDFGVENGQYHMVMQLVRGTDLSDLLKHQGAYSEAAAIALTVKLASALGAAHGLGLVHRDVKPQNIMIAEGGEPILMDFGIAKLLTAETALTQTGVGIGTPAYMSPEQAQGLEVTAASDLYSLIIVLFEMLTGEQPYRAETPIASILRVINEPLPRLRTLVPGANERLESVIIKGTAKSPGDRYEDAQALIRDLQGDASTTDTTVVVPTAAPRQKQQNQRFIAPSKLDLLLISGFVASIALLIGLGIYFNVF